MTISIDGVREANGLLTRHARLKEFIRDLGDPTRDVGVLCGTPHDSATWQGRPLWLGKDPLYVAAVVPVLTQRAAECEARLTEFGVALQ